MPTLRNFFSRIILATITAFYYAAAYAQESKQIDVNINTNSHGGFFASPWVWIIGVSVFILLLVALMRDGSTRKDI